MYETPKARADAQEDEDFTLVAYSLGDPDLTEDIRDELELGDDLLKALFEVDEVDDDLRSEVDQAVAFFEFPSVTYSRGRYGWLVGKVATPVWHEVRLNPDGTFSSARASWGHVWTGWVAGASYDDLFAAAVEWAKARHAEDMKQGTVKAANAGEASL